MYPILFRIFNFPINTYGVFLALAFLVELLARQKEVAPLEAGEIISTGTLTDAAMHEGDTLRRAKRPVYRRACALDEIAPGGIRSALIDDMNVLIARVGEDVYAVRNACGDGPLPLEYSTLEGPELTCSWHGCRYDIRTGRRLDYPNASPEEQLTVLPVRVQDGFVEIVVGTTPVGDAVRPS